MEAGGCHVVFDNPTVEHVDLGIAEDPQNSTQVSGFQPEEIPVVCAMWGREQVEGLDRPGQWHCASGGSNNAGI